MNPPLRVTLLITVVGALPLPKMLAAQAPHLAGTVDIDLPRGMLIGEVCVSNLPEQDTVHFMLNRGMNVAWIRDPENEPLEYDGDYDGEVIGESLEYTIIDSLPAPREFCIRYVGAFPIYRIREGEYRAFDSKGWIAFNGRTLRATEQSRWYPVPVDTRVGTSRTRMSFRLRVRCPTCAAIYLNGAPPGLGPELEAISAVPYAPLLFAGDYQYGEVGGTLYLNSDVSPEAAGVLSARVADIKRFYERFLSVPYGDTIVFLEHQPVERFEPGRIWGFVTWPTIAVAGTSISDFIRDGSLANPELWNFLAHEMGHYYFGPLPGAYQWFFLESVPEYLALKVLEQFAGEEIYQDVLERYYEEVAQEPALPPLDEITEPEMISERYRYRYGPLLLVALEHEIGIDRMGRILRAFVDPPSESRVDYDYLARVAREAGVSEVAWRRFEQQCVRRAPQESCLEQLGR